MSGSSDTRRHHPPDPRPLRPIRPPLQHPERWPRPSALQSWEHSQGHAELDRFAAIEDPTERLQAVLLAAVTFSQSGAPSVHVLLLGELADERVAAVLARVNESRIRLLTRTYSQLGFSRQRAGDRARLAYAAYLGLLQTAREVPGRQLGKRDIARFMTEVNSVLIDRPSPSRAARSRSERAARSS
jgi:hypothetical protein